MTLKEPYESNLPEGEGNAMKCLDIEIAVAEYFNPRANLIVPNVHWGFGVHECDMLIVSKSGYCTEVEIKVSASDLKKDVDKRHHHNSNKIKHLYFAIPEKLLAYKEHIPTRAGILVVSEEKVINYSSSYSSGNVINRISRERYAETYGNYRITEKERYEIARLGALRIWTMKNKLQKITTKCVPCEVRK